MNIWLELGFGRGENLLALAHRKRDDPNFYLVGVEIHNPGIGIACQRIEQSWNNDGEERYWVDYELYSPELDPYSNNHNDSDVQEETETTATTTISPNRSEFDQQQFQAPPPQQSVPVEPYSNMRIHAGDGFKLLSKIPSNSLAAILVTFPDPFPNERDQQYRLIQIQTLQEFHRILRKQEEKKQAEEEEEQNNGGFFFLATDHDGYNVWCHDVMDRVNNENENQTSTDGDDQVPKSRMPKFRSVEPCPHRSEWLPAVSTYERKGWEEGRSTKLSCWVAL
jgi:tRNA G46 methylase TrmB